MPIRPAVASDVPRHSSREWRDHERDFLQYVLTEGLEDDWVSFDTAQEMSHWIKRSYPDGVRVLRLFKGKRIDDPRIQRSLTWEAAATLK